MSLDFGLAFNFRNPEPFKVPPAQFYEEMFQQIEYAEELGFDTVWLPEHHFSPDDGYDPNPLTVAAAIAARTTRIKIGTWLLLLPLHNALEVAEQAALVDIISGGRLQLGLGLGYRKEEFDAFGINRRDRAGRMEEGLEVIRRALGNEQFSFKGRHYDIENGSVYPKPIQQPLPLWVGARSEPAARRAARHDASLLLIDVGGNAKATYDVYAETLRERGRDPADYGVHGMILGSFMISDDPERAFEEVRPHLEWERTAMEGWYEESAQSGHDPVLLDAMDRGQRGGGGRAIENDVVGDPAETIKVIEAKLEEAPYTHMVFGGGNTTPSGFRAKNFYPYLERFAKEVIPHFR